MVVFGGYTGSSFPNDVRALSLAGTPAWTPVTPSGTPPSGREGHSAIYDPVRDRTVVSGGIGSDIFNDVWALSLAGTPTWLKLTPSGTAPSRLVCHSAIYDPVRDRMVVYGGLSDSSLAVADVWALPLADTSAWTQITPSLVWPSARYRPSAIYDPVRNRMVVFGGSQIDFLNEVWAMSLAGLPAWTQVTSSGTPPSGRFGQSAIYDPVRDRMVVFGGRSSASYLNDVWALSLAGTPAWTHVTPTGAPPGARQGHSAIYDPVRDRMVVFGGAASSFVNDVWALSLSGTPAWTQLVPSGTPPAARDFHSAIHDPVRDRMVVFGGYSGSSYFNDVWSLSLAGMPAWTQLTPSGTPPIAQDSPSAVYDPVRDRMALFGGVSGGVVINEVRALSLAGTPAWTQLVPSGTRPSARCRSNAIYDPVRDRMVVFGGYDGSYYYLNDVWTLAWSTVPDVVAPTVHVLSPGGGETLVNGTTFPLMWSATDNVSVQSADLYLSRTGPSGPWELLATGVANTETYSWLVSSAAANNSAYLRVDVRDHAGNIGTAMSASAFTTPTLVELFHAVPTDAGVRIEWELSDPSAFRSIALECAASATGGWVPVAATPIVRGRTTSVLDAAVVSGQERWYRLSGVQGDGGSFTFGPVSVTAQEVVTAFALSPLSPNPSTGRSLVTFAVPTRTQVRLTLIDVQGREVAVLADGVREPGRHTAALEAGALRAGIYFLRMQAGGANLTRRLAVVK